MFEVLIKNTINKLSSSLKKPSRPFVPITVNKTNLTALYDTGADVSCMSINTFRKLFPDVDKRPKKLQKDALTSGATGSRLESAGRYYMPFKIQNKEFIFPVSVFNNLNEKMILGIDFIVKFSLGYDPTTQSLYWSDTDANWTNANLQCTREITLEPMSNKFVTMNVLDHRKFRIGVPGDAVAIISSDKHIIQGGPALVTVNKNGQVSMEIFNCSNHQITIDRDTMVGVIENIKNEDTIEEMNVNTLTTNEEKQKKPEVVIISQKQKDFILANANLNVPPEYKDRYLNLLLRNHDVISSNKYDLGKCNTAMHDIELKTKEPIYIKQFRIPEAQRETVESHIQELLKLGVIRPSRSKYNSPIFVVKKKSGGLRIVQDFRAINAETLVDKYSMRDVQECIDEIGRAGSSIFTTIDLTSGFWQMMLNPECRKFTAFTLPGLGQFEWNASPMGLLGAPGSFQRLMEIVIYNLKNVLAYIDDLLLHTKTHDQHLEILEQLFDRLRQHGLKINLPKCFFGAVEVSYLGFLLTPQGIKPGTDKLKAVAKALPPKDIHEVRQFLGLCNFFRGHVENFAQIAAPLNKLTTKNCVWKKGPLPEDAEKAFNLLKTILCSEPILNYPNPDFKYALITDACQGDCKKPGGFGAILAQINHEGKFQAVSYASRKLKNHEKNYAPFLLEMSASIWAMEHYSVYLKGKPFNLYTDHKPLVTLKTVHNKTLNRLQELMLTYDFETIYLMGSEMPADFLSRNVVEAISTNDIQIEKDQNSEEWIKQVKSWMLNGHPCSEPVAKTVQLYLKQKFFIEDNILWIRVQYRGEPSRVCLVLPQKSVNKALNEGHGTLFTGHEGCAKTKARITQNYWWPQMDKDIAEFIKSCEKCQKTRTDVHPKPDLLTSLPICTEINQRVHADLFGDLRTTDKQKKFILSMTDAFSKYVELVAIPNKEAETVADAIFEHWICRYGVPMEIITDQGKEFCNKLSTEFCKLMELKHGRTSAYHPQCNAQVEVGNKTIAKYLRSVVDSSTLNWEMYLPPLQFSYNTSFHRTIQTSPYFLTFGQLARQPAFNQGDWQKKYLGESTAAEKFQILQKARQIAWENSSHQQNLNQEYYDRHCAPHEFKKDQWVLLKSNNFAHKNRKLAEKYDGPYQIVKLKESNNVEIKINRKRNLIVHVNRLKPYHDSSKFKVLDDHTDISNDSNSDKNSESDKEDNWTKVTRKKTSKKTQSQPVPREIEKKEIKKKVGRPKKVQKETETETETETENETKVTKPIPKTSPKYNLRSKTNPPKRYLQTDTESDEETDSETEKTNKQNKHKRKNNSKNQTINLINSNINLIKMQLRMEQEMAERRRHPFIKHCNDLIKNLPSGFLKSNYPNWNNTQIINYWWSGDIYVGPDEIGFSLSENPYLPPSVQFGGKFRTNRPIESEDEFEDAEQSEESDEEDFESPPGTPQASTSAATGTTPKQGGPKPGPSTNQPSPSTSGHSKYDMSKVRPQLQKADYEKAKKFKDLNEHEEAYFKHRFYYAKWADKELIQEEGRPTRHNPSGIRSFLSKKK